VTKPIASLPFRATVSLPNTLSASQLFLGVSGADPAGSLEQTDKIFSYFATAANGGLFSGDRARPTESLLEVHARDREAGRIRYRCQVRAIDPGGFQILLRLLSESSRRFEPLREVSLTGTSPTTAGMPCQAVLACPLPASAPTLPFELRVGEYSFQTRDPVIRMEFQQPVQDEQFDRIKPLMDAWDNILLLGGYPVSSEVEDEELETGKEAAGKEGETPKAKGESSEMEARSFPVPGEFYLAEPTVLEHILHAFEGPEEAYNAVINMAVRLHSTGCPLVALAIE
jgi:hypothetical protein